MSKLWCVKGNINDGEMFITADAVEISPRGEISFYRENGRRSLVLALAPGAWAACFEALPDGRAAAVHASGDHQERPLRSH
jgi:hypothetical protein